MMLRAGVSAVMSQVRNWAWQSTSQNHAILKSHEHGTAYCARGRSQSRCYCPPGYSPALELVSADLGVPVAGDWVATTAIRDAAKDLVSYQGIWCVPASPYESMQGALDAIQFAREQQIPFLGTCAGFQHALIEYAHNVLGMRDADHAESNPEAVHPLISKLFCSLVEVQSEIVLVPESILHKSYGTLTITEGYHCNYGPSKEWEPLLFDGKFCVAARDATGEVRGGELNGHRFFVGTLFQPERRALKGEAPPIVREFVRAMAAQSM